MRGNFSLTDERSSREREAFALKKLRSNFSLTEFGRAVVAALRERDMAVTAVDREPPDSSWDDGVHVVTGDLAEQETCVAAFETRQSPLKLFGDARIPRQALLIK